MRDIEGYQKIKCQYQKGLLGKMKWITSAMLRTNRHMAVVTKQCLLSSLPILALRNSIWSA